MNTFQFSKKVVRIGSRSESEELLNYTLQSRGRDAATPPQRYLDRQLYNKLKDLTESMKSSLRLLNSDCSVASLREMNLISGEQAHSFFDRKFQMDEALDEEADASDGSSLFSPRSLFFLCVC